MFNPIKLYRTISTYGNSDETIKELIKKYNDNKIGEQYAIIWYIGMNYITYIWLSDKARCGYEYKTKNLDDVSIYKLLEKIANYSITVN